MLEFFGFVFFFPSFMAGPTIEFAAYRDYISLDMFKNKVRPAIALIGALRSI